MIIRVGYGSDIQGDTMRFIGEKDYNGAYITPYHNNDGYTIMELDSDSVVLGYEGQVFLTVHSSDLEKI